MFFYKMLINNRFFLPFLLLTAVFISAITKISDLDAWIHLTMGRLIWTLKGLPDTEPFVYTMLDKPFSYSSWLFGLMYYLAYLMGNVQGVILLKAASVTVAFFILLRDAMRPYKNVMVSVAVLTIVFIIARHRFVERPDTFLMVFLALSIYVINAFVYEEKRYIYALPIIHMLWANSHSSINLMFVPFSAFLISGLLQRFEFINGIGITPTMSQRQMRTILIIFAACFAATLISPYFLNQYVFGAQFLRSDWFKQEILELKPPTWSTFKGHYLFMVGVVLSFMLTPKRFHMAHAIMLLPFAILSLTAIRFIFLFAVVSGPIVARNISGWMAMPEMKARISRGNGIVEKILAGATAIGILASAVFMIVRGAPLWDQKKEFGFGIDRSVLPEGALKYMDSKGIKGRIFNVFQWGQYISWRDFPGRSVFIDGRGYFPAELLESLDVVRHRPALLDKLHSEYGFEAVLLQYPIDSTGASRLNYDRDSLFSHPDWALVYWDDVSLLYLRRGGPYDSVIKRDEYKFIKPANNIEGMKGILHDIDYRNNVVRELKKSVAETGSLKAMTFLGYVYNEAGLYGQAIDSYNNVINRGTSKELQAAYYGIAYSYAKLNNIPESLHFYKKALGLGESAGLHYKVGLAYESLNDIREAVRHFEKAVAIDPGMVSVYPLLIADYQKLGMSSKAELMKRQFESAVSLAAAEEHFNAGVKSYLQKNYYIAIEEFIKAIEKNPYNPAPYSNLGYLYFDIGSLDKAYLYQGKALEVDPEFPNAHYGLALIYNKWGDSQSAKRHWKEYLRLEPAGYFSRKAKQYMEAVP